MVSHHTALKSALSHFEKKSGELIVNGNLISGIINEFSTPLYIYDRSIINWRHGILRENLPNLLDITYAVKANPNIEILRELNKLYDGFDVASKGEIEKAIQANISPDKMSFAGPGKSIEELEFAIKKGVGSISVESEREIAHIEKIAKSFRKVVKILIRVNPAFNLTKSGLKMGGGPKQFGIDSELIPGIVASLVNNDYIYFKGIHIYFGTQILDAHSILHAMDKVLAYAIELKNANRDLDIVNMGGGFGIPYFDKDEDLDIKFLGSRMNDLIDQVSNDLPKVKFKVELGRYIVGECGLYVSEVLYKKKSRQETFLILNGGMHHHLAASGNLGQAFLRPMPIATVNKLDENLEKVNLVGPLCTPIDTFGHNLLLPKAEEGDLVAVLNSGAYGYSASPMNFLSHPSPQEVII